MTQRQKQGQDEGHTRKEMCQPSPTCPPGPATRRGGCRWRSQPGCSQGWRRRQTPASPWCRPRHLLDMTGHWTLDTRYLIEDTGRVHCIQFLVYIRQMKENTPNRVYYHQLGISNPQSWIFHTIWDWGFGVMTTEQEKKSQIPISVKYLRIRKGLDM